MISKKRSNYFFKCLDHDSLDSQGLAMMSMWTMFSSDNTVNEQIPETSAKMQKLSNSEESLCDDNWPALKWWVTVPKGEITRSWSQLLRGTCQNWQRMKRPGFHLLRYSTGEGAFFTSCQIAALAWNAYDCFDKLQLTRENSIFTS